MLRMELCGRGQSHSLTGNTEWENGRVCEWLIGDERGDFSQSAERTQRFCLRCEENIFLTSAQQADRRTLAQAREGE